MDMDSITSGNIYNNKNDPNGLQDPILNSMSGQVGPFASSERVPLPNTLPETETFEDPSHVNTRKFETPKFTFEYLTKVYHAAHIYILFLFIAVYLVIYVFLAMFLKNNGTDNIELVLKRIFDYSMALILIAGCVYYYVSASQETQANVIPVLWNWSIQWMEDPVNMYGIVLFSIAFYIWVFFMHINMRSEYTPFLIRLLEDKLWIILVFFVLFFTIQHFFDIDIYGFFFGNDLVNGILTKVSDHEINDKGELVIEKGNTVAHSGNTVVKHDQVFNISNNLYSYEDAQHICTAYGARLANYDEIEEAYNHGAEWCNYGWSEGQMAYFPTQKSTWDILQKNPANKNKCGRPGVNGGYIDNKFLRFGVNCFGKKPEPTPAELAMMNQPLPQNAEQSVIDQKVAFWKKNAEALLKLNSFNRKQWSEY